MTHYDIDQSHLQKSVAQQQWGIESNIHEIKPSDKSTIDFTAQIKDSESGALIIADLETRLVVSIHNSEVEIDAVYLRDFQKINHYLKADESLDPFVLRLAAIIREQAMDNDDFLSLAFEANEAPIGRMMTRCKTI